MNRLIVLLAVFAAIALAGSTVSSAAWLNSIIAVLYVALLGQAWNILGGYGGQFSFGHAAFFGTGAYTVAVLQVQLGVNPWIGLVAGGLAGAVVALIIGGLVFRYGLRGSYFALVTLAFAEVLRILANSVPFTGAGVGILIPLDQRTATLQFADKIGYFWLVWVLALAAFLTVWWLGESRFGARLMAVRDNEDAAIALSGFFSALAGVFYAQLYLYLDPGIAYGAAVSVEALLVPIIGGLGTLFGPLLGAAVLHLVSEASRAAIGDAPGISLVLYGALLVVMVTFLPRGLAGIGAQTARRLLTMGAR
jgi:branched-chain amino acid transport system permease protein